MSNNADTPRFLGLHAKPKGLIKYALMALPFILMIALYLVASDVRHKANPQDKLLPSISQMASSAQTLAFEENKRTGTRLLWQDSAASLKRLAMGISIAAIFGLVLGVMTGVFPGAHVLLNPFLTFVSMIPPLAILPVLFITLGVEETAKVALITLGLFPLIARDMQLAVQHLPGEQKTKALTLGATAAQYTLKIVLPQVLPRLIEAVRLSLGAAWLFLIAAEAISAESGLGYRIFLVRRYLAMDIILPYVLWITLLGFLIDLGLRGTLRLCFPWYASSKNK